MDKLRVGEAVQAQVVRQRDKLDDILDRLEGKYKIEHIRDGKIIAVYDGKNLITNAGKNSLLNVMFQAATQITAWYIGLVDNTSFSAFAAADTMASHAGWIENTGYSDATRIAWSVGASSSQSITNASAAVFNINATSTIKGIFITSVSTKGGSTGTLWSGVAFAANISVTSGDQLKITYTVND